MRPNIETSETIILESAEGSKTAEDDAILRAQGHEPEMPRSFSLLSALGLAFR